MEFSTPAGFWLGLAGAGVLLAHLVRRRARRHTVAFLPLWAAVQAQRRGGFGAAIVRYVDLLLVLLACLAVAAAAGTPVVPGRPDATRDLVLLLDGGVELRAGERLFKLRKVAEAEVRRRVPGTRIVVVSGGAITATDPLDAVRAHRPGWLRETPDFALAREAAKGLRRPDLVFVTYRPGLPEGFRLRAVREPVKNAGIASVEIRSDPEGGGRVARLGLVGLGPVRIGDVWSGEVSGSRSVDVALQASLTVTSEGDGFRYDDTVRFILPERKVPRVLVVAQKDASPFLISALEALAETRAVRRPLDRTTPDRAAEAAAHSDYYDVVVFDRCAPPAGARGLRALYLAPPQGALPFKVGEWAAAPALFLANAAHPLLQGFDLERIAPLRARAVFGGETLASAAPGPVLCATAGWIALGFDPDRCIFASSPAYPLFLRNCIAHLAESAPPRRPEFLAVGEAAPVKGIAEVGDGQRLRVAGRLLGPPGYWRIGEETYAVNLLLPDLDLRGPDHPSDPLPPVGRPATPDRPLAPAFGGAALFLLLVAWWIFWRA